MQKEVNNFSHRNINKNSNSTSNNLHITHQKQRYGPSNYANATGYDAGPAGVKVRENEQSKGTGGTGTGTDTEGVAL